MCVCVWTYAVFLGPVIQGTGENDADDRGDHQHHNRTFAVHRFRRGCNVSEYSNVKYGARGIEYTTRCYYGNKIEGNLS